jgi:uncharacterized tellurite resistance protein B-like protein
VLRALTAFFERTADDQEGSAESRERELQLATAVLLVEIARADFDQDDQEVDAIERLLQSHLAMSKTEARRLVHDAMQQADAVASLQSFTRQLHEELELDEKLRVVEMLWRVALADSVLDKHEDFLVRQIADLLYVSHGDMIRIRNVVREERG